MIKYIIENKEWLFSGVGVVIFGCAFTFFMSLIKNKKKIITKHPVTESKPIEQLEKIEDSNRISISANSISTLAAKSVSHLTVKEIIDEIHNLPPYQQKSGESRYNGIIVEWSGKLWNVESIGYPNKNENLVQIEFNPHQENLHYRVLMDADLREYPELRVIYKKRFRNYCVRRDCP